MLSNEQLDRFRETYKIMHGRDLSREQALGVALFENAVLHAQNFVFAAGAQHSLNDDERGDLAGNVLFFVATLIYSLILVGNQPSVDKCVLDEWKAFLKKSAGITDDSEFEEYWKIYYESINRKMMWLSVGGLSKESVVNKLTSDTSPLYREQAEVLYNNVMESMRHFGI